MSDARSALRALASAQKLFEEQDTALAEKERVIRMLGEQLNDALDEVAALRSQLVSLEMNNGR